jgi:glycosyltransferase involved in cell wall biosynthesis
LRDPMLRARLTENARHLVRSKYNWQSIGRQFNQLIESLAKSSQSTPTGV